MCFFQTASKCWKLDEVNSIRFLATYNLFPKETTMLGDILRGDIQVEHILEPLLVQPKKDQKETWVTETSRDTANLEVFEFADAGETFY